jgi:hypothetical protein
MKPIPDKAEIALEYPDKFYLGTFERSSRFDAHLDKEGISLTLQRSGDAEARKSVHIHLHYGLFADVLKDLAKTAASQFANEEDHWQAMREAVKALYLSLETANLKSARGHGEKGKRGTIAQQLTPDEEVRLLHIME